MPYVTQPEREELKTARPTTVGQLNYVITKLALKYREAQTFPVSQLATEIRNTIAWYMPEKKNYELFNGIIGVLQCARLEYARRTKRRDARDNRILFILDTVRDDFYKEVVAPYEDMKIALNGDIPEYQKQVVDTPQ